MELLIDAFTKKIKVNIATKIIKKYKFLFSFSIKSINVFKLS